MEKTENARNKLHPHRIIALFSTKRGKIHTVNLQLKSLILYYLSQYLAAENRFFSSVRPFGRKKRSHEALDSGILRKN